MAALLAFIAPLRAWARERPRTLLLALAAAGALYMKLAMAATFTVTSVADTAGSSCAATCTLRQAITAANASGASGNTIAFNIPSGSCSGGVCAITLGSALPNITRAVTIDGSTQSGYTSTPVIELRGGSTASGTSGLTIFNTSGVTIRALAIRNFDGSGIVIDSGSGGHTIAGNHIGLNAAGTSAQGNNTEGINLYNSPGNTIGGTATRDRNVISGNGNNGIVITGSSAKNNVVLGNYIGTNAAGTAALANGSLGIYLSSSSNTIGGTTASARNVISGNTWTAVYLDAGATGSVVQGNYIGVNAAGSAAIANGAYGVYLLAGSSSIGGSTSGAGNVISGNGADGIWVQSGSNTIQGNIIGLDAAGTSKVRNASNGIVLSKADGNTVGGSSAAARNVISGHDSVADMWDAIFLYNSSDNNVIKGNYLGTDITGTKAIGNSYGGVTIYGGKGNVIGGTAAGEANLIANNRHGVEVTTSTDTAEKNIVSGNSIHSNTKAGILLEDSLPTNDGNYTSGKGNQLIDAPVFSTVSYAAGTLKVAGYVGSAAGQGTFKGSTIEVFESSTTSGNGQGRTYLGSLTAGAGSGDFSGSLSVASLTAGASITATARDSAGNTSIFSANFKPATGQTVSGTVFEDVNYGGGAGRSLSSSSGIGRGSVTVELYNSSGVWQSSTTTDSSGAYSFAALAAGTYHVRVVSSTVSSSRYVSGTLPVAVMTYRTTATSGSAVAVTDFVGGTNPAVADPGSASSGATFNTTSYVYSAGLSGTAHAVAAVTVASSNITGIDFGFNFDTVVNTNDSGQGSLRQAVANANTLAGEASLAQSGLTAGAEHLNFMISNGGTSPGGALAATGGLRSTINYFSGSPATATITLSSGEIAISGALRLPGASTATRISGNGSSRIFNTTADVLVSNLTLISGTVNGNGGCVLATGGSLGFTGVTLSGCTASNGQGGAVHATGTTLTLTSSTVQNGQATSGNGGGLWVSGGSATVTSSTLSGNNATNGGGGALWLAGAASASVTDSTFGSNRTGTTGGAGIGMAASGTLTISGATFTANDGTNGGGGGLYVASGTATVSNATFNGNSTYNGGGAVAVAGGSLTMVNVTVAGNSVMNGAAGLWRSAGTLSLRNTLVSGNTGGSGNCSGTITSLSNNLDSGTTCGFGSANGSLSSASANLAALASNGGPTQTMALQSPSAAINAGTSTGAPSTDQRGVARTGPPDIGAYESAVAAGYGITGTVFEDVHYGGGAGRDLATATAAGGQPRSGARVELSSISGSTATVVAVTTTDATGAYAFSNQAAGSYYVRVVSGSVTSSRNPSASGLLPVKTFHANGSGTTVTAVTNEVGGASPAGTSNASNTANVGTTANVALAASTAEGIASVTLTSASIAGIDFGFNFDTVVNTNASGQGSLAQAITNANTLGNDGQLAQSGRTAGIENLVFMISNGSSAAGLRSSLNYFATSAGSYNVATIAPTAALPVVSEALVIDAQTQPGWTQNPIIELNGTSAGSGGGLKFTASGNVVRGLVINRFTGDGINLASTGNTVAGNWVGLNAAGTAASANTTWGVEVNAGSNTVGGSTAATRNVISGNGDIGIYVRSGSGNILQGNYVGTNAAGTAAIGNATFGVMVHSNTSGTVIGGSGAGQGNLISGNPTAGLRLRSGSGSNVIRGNIIGFNAAGANALPNGIGIQIDAAGSNNQIGGTGSSDGNLIAGNTGSGIAIWGTPASNNNAILGNRIHSNGGIGIDLGLASATSGNGITVNTGSTTTGEPNLLMNYPVFTSVNLSGTTLTVQGYVGSAAGQSAFANARVEVFVSDNSATHGSGQTYLGFLTTDASGNFSGSLTGISGVTTGSTRITGTATDSSNNTSEFGPNVTVGRSIAGSLFEDLNYGGGAGRSKAASGGAAIASATVELIGSDGLLKASTVTAADGSYKFSGIGDGHYIVRVPIATVRSTRSGSTAALLGVQTWRYEASWSNPGPVTGEVGGMDPAASDGATGVASYGWTACADENNTCSFSGTRLVRYGAGSTWTTRVLTGGTACTNGVFGDPLFGTYKACQILNASLHSVASASTLNGDVSGLDFGFNFDTVVNTNDSGAGSLRQAITNANAFVDDNLLTQVGRTAGLEHLVFMIPNGSAAAGLRSGLNAFSGGVATITPASALPAVSSSLVLDAQTQPGWTANPLLQINGSSSGGDCLTLSAGSSVLRGWVINRCPGAGLSISGGNAHQVQGNWIGLNSAGTAASTAGGSFANAVYIVNASGVTLGGSSATQRNVLSGTLYAGLYIGSNTTTLTVQGNYIGTNATGSAAVGNAVGGIRWASSISGTSGIVVTGNLISGNTGDGVRVTASGATIGVTLSSAANVISGNSGNGVSVSGSTTSVAVLGNSIFGNGSLGIDLGTDGVTANDGAKTSGAPNLKMDFPVFTSARSRGNQLTVAGYVGSAAGQATFAGARVELFVSDNDGSGYGEGKTWLGTLTSDGSGNFSGTVTMPVATLALGTRLTATATDGSNNTSEFGPQFNNLLVDFVVNSTLDEVDASIGDGQCQTASGVCTLRAAIAELNAWAALPQAPTIAFALPGCSAAGQAACRIAPATALPNLTRAMVVDAQTQPGWTLSPIVELYGSGAPSFASGLMLQSSGITVRGFVIGGFGQAGISIAASNITVEGNWIGLTPDGSTARANGAFSAATGGVYISSGTGIVVGGTTAAQRNVLSGNGGAGLWADGGTVTVTGNYIGTNAAGTAAVGNGRWGISLEGGASHRIGGSAAGEGNVVSGNTGWETGGMIVRGTGVVIQGNLIGLNAAGTAAVPNGVAGSSYAAGIDARSGSGHQVGGSAAGEANVIAYNIGAGVHVGSQTTRISGNSIYNNTGLGIDLVGDGVTANNGSTSGSAPNNGIDHPVITGAGVGGTQASLTVFGYVGTGTGQAVFAGTRIEFFKAAADSTGYGEGQVYLGALTADGNGRFNGTINFTAGLVAVGDAITATTTDGSGNTSEFGPNWTSTTVAGLTPAGFNAFETDTAASAITGVIRSKVAGSAATLAVVALNSTGTALHAGFSGSVALSWLDARDDSGAISGSCRASWTTLGAAGTATFANNNRVNVSLTPPASGTRSMRLKMTYTNGATVVTACSGDAFAALPATLTLVASDADAATAGNARSLNNTGASGGVVHRAGRPFTVSSQARDANGALMTGYDGTPLLAVAGCVLPAGCSAGSLSSTATAAVAGVYGNATVSYAEVGAVQLQLTDASYASVDSGDTAAAARTISSAVVDVGRFVPDSLSVAVSTAGSFATANGACLAAGSGATFIGQGFGWTTAPQVTVTAKNAAGNTTTLWTGSLMKLSGAAQAPGLAVSAAGAATLSSSFGAITITDLGGGSARALASSLDRFVLDLPAGTPQASVTPAWTWNLAVNDASEAAVAGNPTLSASAVQGGVPFDLGATFHSGRLALAAAHGDARAGVRSLVQLQRWTSAGWVTMTEDRGCITVQPQHLGVETPSGIFSSSGDCVAPMGAAVTTAGGRAWIALPATPGAAPGRLTLRLAGDAASGHSCSGTSSAPLVSLGRPWLLGGSGGAGPAALATWGAPNRDVVLRRETW